MHFSYILRFFFYILWKEKKSFSVFEGARYKPFEHTMTFFRKMFQFFLTFMKNAFDTNSRIFAQKYTRNKKKRNF